MPRPKGLPKTGGRKAGTPNKMNKGVREAWDEAIEVAQGTKGYSLAEWAISSKEANEKFWLATIRLAPKEVKLDATEAVADLLAQARARAAR